MATDPTCRMTVDEKTAPHTDYNAQTYYFCSQQCSKRNSKKILRNLSSRPRRHALCRVINMHTPME